MQKKTHLTTNKKQYDLDLEIAIEREVDGIGMGVLTDGTPYLNIRGLASMCGVDHSMIVRITGEWLNDPLKAREQKIRELVRAQGADDRLAFIAIRKEGTIHHIIPAPVCMAVLEYYAFEARTENEHASNSYRLLARRGFENFIYSQVGYNPNNSTSIAWKQFHDRVSLSYHTVPDGYFSIFKEIADIIVTMIREGADIGSTFIPDISVGIHWGKYWNDENLDFVYGERLKYNHNYPSYFPQAESNPQTPFCYPEDALGEFRKWVREVYLPEKFPKYLNEKVKQGAITHKNAAAAIQAFKPKLIKK